MEAVIKYLGFQIFFFPDFLQEYALFDQWDPSLFLQKQDFKKGYFGFWFYRHTFPLDYFCPQE